ncbi:MAG: XdhC family protein [Planctomycetaceae bacterium]|nr:XdhC family protein [Planctomycetaceae bacterium]
MANEDRLWRIAHERLLAGEKLVLCTLVASHGSTPREAGARMLIGAHGLLAGTVGGGCGEAEVMVSARKVFAGNLPSALLNVDLAGDLNQTETQACGGSMDVYVETLDQRLAATIGLLADSEEHRKRRVVATKIGGGGEESLLLIAPEGERAKILTPALHEYTQIDAAKLVTVGSDRWFVQPVGTREVLVIVGSGHVAQPLSRMAAMLGYRVVVIDDRSAFANETNFPDASSIVVSSHAAGLKTCGIDGFTNIVIITRGHQFDEEALREALNHSPRYIGMIGSKRRALATLKRISETNPSNQPHDGCRTERHADDVSQAQRYGERNRHPVTTENPSLRLDSGFRRNDGQNKSDLVSVTERVHTPIGLDIGAQTPEEIALAIMAEVVAQRRGGSGMPLMTLRATPKR